MFRLYGSLLVTTAIVFDDGVHAFLARRSWIRVTKPGPYQVSDGSPWKMFLNPFCFTKSTFPCQVLTWNIGTPECPTNESSIEVSVVQCRTVGATFWVTNSARALVSTFGCWP